MARIVARIGWILFLVGLSVHFINGYVTMVVEDRAYGELVFFGVLSVFLYIGIRWLKHLRQKNPN